MNNRAAHNTITGSRISRLALCIILSLLVVSVQAASLPERIDALLSSPELSQGVQGVLVQSLATGAVLYSHNPDTSLIPASNTKIFTAAAALDKLGPNFTYRTSVHVTGKLSPDGVLNGSIVLKGGGDPVLGVDDLDALAVKIRHLGVRKVTGSIIADDTLFDSVRLGEGWAWDYLADYYAAEISALNVHRNVVDVYVRPGTKAGAPGVVTLFPHTQHIALANTVRTVQAGGDHAVTITRDPGGNIIKVSGKVPADRVSETPESALTVKDPHIYAGNVLKQRLSARGVQVAGKVVGGKLPQDAKLVAERVSPPLSTILGQFMKPSDNLIGEVLLKTLGSAIFKLGSASAGLEVEREFLRSAGLNPGSVSLVDGSGLSRLNQATPRSILNLLIYMRSHKHANIFLESMPIGGVDGTLKRRMKSTPAESNVRAKTGTLRHVSCLSGYMTGAGGEPLVFSIMMNGHSDNEAARKIQDRICAMLAGE